MGRIAPRVYQQAGDIARLQAIANQLLENERVRVVLADGSTVEGIVELTPSMLVFFDPDGREGMNATLRLEAFLDDGRPHPATLFNIWLDEIDAVTRLPNPSPPEPSLRSGPADPNAPVVE
ncbi:DUF3247 family protein [Cognatiluteimonas profundi]|uniref:DUF3247 family protein n=1 Tax=Cognatiluteimonas profundi TaxID=2594501 RepID=UPI00131DFD83|nr:DUF3247 family protein [Lysobacter profundi]